MANLALYRKYRPRTFDEVIGQEHVTGPLIQALKNGRLHHAYLFSGPRGCGKTSSARILARSLNCAEGPTPSPCDTCDSCVALAPDGPGSLDVIEIDAASHGGVDDARDLRERAFFAPVASRYKIYVIDEAHMVSSAGFNALLKLVEEPPDFVKFVFATTEPEKVLTTIRSRTHHYPFRLIAPGVLRTLLEQVCGAEQVTVEPAVFPLVVRAGGGSARDALSILDQLLAGSGDGGVTYARAVALLGVTDTALLDDACEALAAADGGALFATVDRVVEAGHDPRRFAADLLVRLRDLLILQKVPDAAAKGLIDVPADELERMTGQALRLGEASVSRMADTIHAGLVEMRGTTSPRLLLELVCARMLLPGADDSRSALLQRLERLERRFDIAPPAAPAPTCPPAPVSPARTVLAATPSTPSPTAPVSASPPSPTAEPAPAPAPVPAPAREAARPDADDTPPVGAEPAPSVREAPSPAGSAVVPSEAPVVATGGRDAAAVEPPAGPVEPPAATVAGQLDAAAVRRIWPEILERVKKRRVVWSLLQHATPRQVAGDELLLAVAHQGLVRRFSDDQVVALVQEALRDVLGVQWRIRAEPDATGGAGSAGGPRAPGSADGSLSPGGPGSPSGPGAPGGGIPAPTAVGAAEPGPEEWPDVAAVGPPPDEPAPDDLRALAVPSAVEPASETDALALLQQHLGARAIRQADDG